MKEELVTIQRGKIYVLIYIKVKVKPKLSKGRHVCYFIFLNYSFFNVIVAQSISIAQSEQQSDKSVSVNSPNTSSSNLNTG